MYMNCTSMKNASFAYIRLILFFKFLMLYLKTTGEEGKGWDERDPGRKRSQGWSHGNKANFH